LFALGADKVESRETILVALPHVCAMLVQQLQEKSAKLDGV